MPGLLFAGIRACDWRSCRSQEIRIRMHGGGTLPVLPGLVGQETVNKRRKHRPLAGWFLLMGVKRKEPKENAVPTRQAMVRCHGAFPKRGILPRWGRRTSKCTAGATVCLPRTGGRTNAKAEAKTKTKTTKTKTKAAAAAFEAKTGCFSPPVAPIPGRGRSGVPRCAARGRCRRRPPAGAKPPTPGSSRCAGRGRGGSPPGGNPTS